jgi:hypothetical protein
LQKRDSLGEERLFGRRETLLQKRDSLGEEGLFDRRETL